LKAIVVALFSGALFGAGLVVSGMTDPANIVRFLDFSGHFSPNLLLVMGGAVGVHATALRLFAPRTKTATPLAARRPYFDVALVGGSAIFGVGWGLGGYCPGPAIASLGFGTVAPAVFVVTSVIGILFGQWATRAPGTDGEISSLVANAAEPAP
jgi:uncharacterized membrane protein YedE/YeeE